MMLTMNVKKQGSKKNFLVYFCTGICGIPYQQKQDVTLTKESNSFGF